MGAVADVVSASSCMWSMLGLVIQKRMLICPYDDNSVYTKIDCIVSCDMLLARLSAPDGIKPLD